ncbi:MAG: PEP-CTERM sorting domain-containing protein [Thermoguttaceae bacterium]|nr:PEP-CTERM sorting domain-containing protein [Thermoguttaceae bacterium]
MPKQLTLLGGLLAAVLFSVAAVQAEDMDYYWTGASNSNYFTTGNWNVGAPDGETATVSLDSTTDHITAYMNSTSGTVNFDYSHLGNGVYSLNVGQKGGTETAALNRGGDLTIADGKSLSLYDGGTLTFNASGKSFFQNGTVNVDGGNLTVTAANSYRVGNANNAALNIKDGELTVNSPAYIGVSANTGTINQTGGTATFNGALDLGWGNGAVGEYNLNGGVLNTNGEAGLWTGNAAGISTFTVDGGTANFNKSGESFTVGLGGTNELANVFTLSSGTVNAADVFAVKYGGVLNVAGGEFNAQTVTVDGASNFNMTDGTATIKSIDMNGGTFIQEGGTLQGTTSINGSYTLNSDATFVPTGALAVLNTATLNGTVDLSNFTNYVGTYGETIPLVSATTVAGTPTIVNAPADWTITPTATGITAAYEGGEGKAYWTGASNNTYYTGSNWTINGVQVTDTYIGGNPAQYNKDCYILTTNGSVNIDWSDLGVASLTVGNGIGGEGATAEVSRGGQTIVKTNLTINKGGTATIGGAFSITNLNNVPGTLTVNGGTFNANNTTEVTGNLIVDDGNFNAKGGTTVNDGGKITVNGGAFTYASSSNFVDNGNITVTGGDFIVNPGSGTFRVGGAVDSASFNVEGGKATFNTNTYVATSSNGTFNQSGGETEFNADLALGWGNYAGTYNLTGGTLNANAAAGLWNANGSGNSTFNVEGGVANFNQAGESFSTGLGGTNELANVFNLLSGEVNAADTFAVEYGGTLNVDGDGVLNAKQIEINTKGTLELTDGTINLGEGGITSTDGEYNISLGGGTFGTNGASWSSALDATIADGATVTFAPEVGETITWAGNLDGDVRVAGEGTFNLVGTVDGDVYVESGAHLAGDADLNNLFLNVNLDELTEPIAINNNINGAVEIEFFTENALDYLDNPVTFLTSGSQALLSASYKFPDIEQGYMWTYGNDGNSFWVNVAEAPAASVPEPSTWALLIIGAAGLLYWRKK